MIRPFHIFLTLPFLTAVGKGEAAVTTMLNGDNFEVEVTVPSSLTVTVVGGLVKINGNDPTSGPLNASSVQAFDIILNSDNASHDLTGITSSEFTSLFSANISIEGTSQTVLGPEASSVYLPGGSLHTITGGPNRDILVLNKFPDNIDFDGNGGSDDVDFIGLETADSLNLNSAPSDSIAVSDGSKTLVNFRDVRFFDAILNGGDDTVNVGPGITANLQRLNIVPGTGNDTMNCGNATFEVLYDRFELLGDDVLTAPQVPGLAVIYQFQLFDQANSTSLTSVDEGMNHKVTFNNGLNVGTFTFNYGTRIFATFGTNNDTFDFSNIEGFIEGTVVALGNNGDDTFLVPMSETINYDLRGGGQSLQDVMIIDGTGYMPVLGSDVITDPVALDVVFTEIEDVNFVGVSGTPSPTPSPTPTPTLVPQGDVKPKLLGLEPGNINADRNNDFFVDAADLYLELGP